jgi:signal transduction histidine kinase
VQEALTNVAKHANATRASVCLHRAAEVIQLTIEDDGVGFVPRLVCRGLGLISIRERVAQLRGTMHVDSAPETGTRLSVQFPLSLRVPNGDAEPEVAQDSHPNSEAEPLRRYERQL